MFVAGYRHPAAAHLVREGVVQEPSVVSHLAVGVDESVEERILPRARGDIGNDGRSPVLHDAADFLQDRPLVGLVMQAGQRYHGVELAVLERHVACVGDDQPLVLAGHEQRSERRGRLDSHVGRGRREISGKIAAARGHVADAAAVASRVAERLQHRPELRCARVRIVRHRPLIKMRATREYVAVGIEHPACPPALPPLKRGRLCLLAQSRNLIGNHRP
jgi:hypothetical protein